MDLEGYMGSVSYYLESTAAERLTSYFCTWFFAKTFFRHETFYECCPEPFVDITYTINLRQKGIISFG